MKQVFVLLIALGILSEGCQWIKGGDPASSSYSVGRCNLHNVDSTNVMYGMDAVICTSEKVSTDKQGVTTVETRCQEYGTVPFDYEVPEGYQCWIGTYWDVINGVWEHVPVILNWETTVAEPGMEVTSGWFTSPNNPSGTIELECSCSNFISSFGNCAFSWGLTADSTYLTPSPAIENLLEKYSITNLSAAERLNEVLVEITNISIEEMLTTPVANTDYGGMLVFGFFPNCYTGVYWNEDVGNEGAWVTTVVFSDSVLSEGDNVTNGDGNEIEITCDCWTALTSPAGSCNGN